MSCTSVRWRLFAPTILPALKSCMRCSPCAATVPDMPEPIMLMRMLPGASAANTACIRFASALMGAQFVSPSTRVPTSISATERTSETMVSQTGNSSE